MTTLDDALWQRAVCRSGQYDPDMWFTDTEEDQAAAICQLFCAIRESCLQYALDAGEEHGVWGGLTAQQRRVIGWRKSRVRCPGCRGRDVTQDADGRTQTCWSCALSWKI